MLPKLNTLHQAFWWTMLSLVNGYTNANNNIICIIAVFQEKRGKKTCQISDGFASCLSSRKSLLPHRAAQQPTTCLLRFWIHVIQSRKHSRAIRDRESWTYLLSTVINLKPFATNFRFRLPFKDCLHNWMCLSCILLYFFFTRSYDLLLANIYSEFLVSETKQNWAWPYVL